MSTTTTTTTTDLDWAHEQLEAIEPTQNAIRAFDASADGARFLHIVGMTMWTNLGGFSLPATTEDEE